MVVVAGTFSIISSKVRADGTSIRRGIRLRDVAFEEAPYSYPLGKSVLLE